MIFKGKSLEVFVKKSGHDVLPEHTRGDVFDLFCVGIDSGSEVKLCEKYEVGELSPRASLEAFGKILIADLVSVSVLGI